LVTPVNQPILNAAGQQVGTDSNACGVYRNLGYSVVDQETPAVVIQGPSDVAIGETFSGFTGTGSAPSPLTLTIDLVNSPQADLLDTTSLAHKYPTCLATNENQSFTQAFSLTYGGKTFPLSLTNSISMGSFDGSLADNVTIKTH
jgi:hypothetical protein